MKNYFNTKEEAEQYREKHELYVRVAEYIPCMSKWSLVFNLTAKITERPSNPELRG